VFHVVNRAIQGQLLFQDFGEYLAFRPMLARTLDVVPIKVFAYCLMPNHVHFLVLPAVDGQLGIFMKRLTAHHAQSLRRWRGTEGRGAMYQGRFHASPVHTEDYFYTVAKYIERNPVRAGLVERAEDWLWSSASASGTFHGIELADWPLPKGRDWLAFVNEIEREDTLEFVRRRTQRNQPLSDRPEDEPIPAIVAARRIATSEED
jgi:putative transposase